VTALAADRRTIYTPMRTEVLGKQFPTGANSRRQACPLTQTSLKLYMS